MGRSRMCLFLRNRGMVVRSLSMRWQLLVGALAFTSAVSGQTSDPTAGAVSCAIGPLTKIIGGNAWPVYACADGKSLAVVSTPNVEPTWFYFIVARKGDGYAVRGESRGDKSVTKPVRDELSAMSPDAVAALYQEVKRSAEVNAPPGQAPKSTLEPPRDP